MSNARAFSSPHGDFSFSITFFPCTWLIIKFSSPHGDFSFSMMDPDWFRKHLTSFRPLTGISLFLSFLMLPIVSSSAVFVPSRGFLFFYAHVCSICEFLDCFRPLTGISLFLSSCRRHPRTCLLRFRPLTGISLFLYYLVKEKVVLGKKFSSPHGDFSFSICFDTSVNTHLEHVFVPSRGFLFFYPISYSPYKSRAIFIICGANIFKPSECYF